MANMESSQGGSEHPLYIEQSGPSSEQPPSHENTGAGFNGASDPDPDDPCGFHFLSEHVSKDWKVNWRWQLFKNEDRSMGATEVWWPKVRSHIIAFVHELIPRMVTMDMFDREVKARLTWIAEGRAEFYIRGCFGPSSKRYFQFDFFEAWLWHVLYDNLFSWDCKDKWREGPWAGFGSILYNMQDKLQHVENEFTSSFFVSRQFTARILHLHHGHHSDPSRLKAILLQHFGRFILAKNPSYSVLEKTLNDLVDTALRMDLAMLGNRLDIRIEMTDPGTGLRSGFGFVEHSKYMEIRSGIYGQSPEHGRSVDFVTFPMLRIHGKRTGYFPSNLHHCLFTRSTVMDYNVDTVHRRMGVILGPDYVDPLPARLQPPTDKQQDGQGDDEDDDEDDEDAGGDADSGGGKEDDDGASAGHDDGNADETADNDEHLPGSGQQLPDDDEQLPDNHEQQTSVNNEQLPENDEHPPGSGQQLPDDDEQLPNIPEQQQPDDDGQQLPDNSEGHDAQPEPNGQSNTDQQTHGDGHARHMEQEAEPQVIKYRLRRQERVDYTFVRMANKRRHI